MDGITKTHVVALEAESSLNRRSIGMAVIDLQVLTFVRAGDVVCYDWNEAKKKILDNH